MHLENRVKFHFHFKPLFDLNLKCTDKTVFKSTEVYFNQQSMIRNYEIY